MEEDLSARTIVFGYGELAVEAVNSLASVGADLVAVVIPSNRTGEDVERFRAFAEQRGLPVLTQPPRKSVETFVGQLRQFEPDFILVWSYPMILPKAIIEVPRGGAFNMHGGILPEYRGGHVMQWAIINGEKETAITLHHVDEGIDTGPVVAESRFPIEWNDNAASVRDKLKSAGGALLREWWPLVVIGQAPCQVQDEKKACYYRLRTQEDGLIDWRQASTAVYNLVRALVLPWPGAFTFLRGRKMIVWETIPDSSGCYPVSTSRAGQVLVIDESGAKVKTGDGCVIVRKVEVDGRVIAGLSLKELISVGEVFGR